MAMRLLPDPDSPTIASASPSPMENDTPSTASSSSRETRRTGPALTLTTSPSRLGSDDSRISRRIATDRPSTENSATAGRYPRPPFGGVTG